MLWNKEASFVNPVPVQSAPVADPNVAPPTRGIIDKAKDLGMMGVGAVAAIPSALSRIQVKPNLREIQ